MRVVGVLSPFSLYSVVGGVNGVKVAPPLIYISKRQSRELGYVNDVGGLVSQPTMKRIPKSVR